MTDRERPQYTGKYEVLGDVELVGEEAVEAERQIAQADSESKLRQTHFASGFDAGRASAQSEIERLQQEIEHVRSNHVTVAEELQRRHDAVASLAAKLAATRAVVEAARVTVKEWNESADIIEIDNLVRALAALDAAEKATADSGQ